MILQYSTVQYSEVQHWLQLTVYQCSGCLVYTCNLQGRIACANVLSDLYAMGVVDCHNMLMLLAVSKEMTDLERDIVVPLMMQVYFTAQYSTSALHYTKAHRIALH